jgi:hypothetical protein
MLSHSFLKFLIKHKICSWRDNLLHKSHFSEFPPFTFICIKNMGHPGTIVSHHVLSALHNSDFSWLSYGLVYAT